MGLLGSRGMASNDMETLTTLLHMGEGRRRVRAEERPVISATMEDGQISGVVTGEKTRHQCRITLSPRRGFACTCPDFQFRARKVGPCKHVLALASVGVDHLKLKDIFR